MSCTGLVMFMTPGLALFYGGLVREKAATGMMLQNFVALGILSMLWYVCGFSFSFDEGVWVGGTKYLFFNNLSKHEPWPALTISQELFALFQMMFGVITPILMTGTFAERMRFPSYLLFICVWSLLVYYPWCHQIWGGGYLQKLGVWDFAGGIVVHSTAGWSALATALALGPRQVKKDGKDLAEPHNVPMVMIGTGILWFGWFGFNGGSALGINETAVTAVTNSHFSASTALVVWSAIDWYREGKAKLVPQCIACVAGLVVVTPSCGYIQPHEAIVVGIVAGTLCYGAVLLLNKLQVDDALDVWGVHGVGGAVGTLLIAVLADGPDCIGKNPPDWCVFPNSAASTPEQLKLQCIGTFACIIHSFVTTYVIVKLMMLIMPVRPDESQVEDLDRNLHGESSYLWAEQKYASLVHVAEDENVGTSSRTLALAR